MKNRKAGLALSYTYFALNTLVSIFLSSFIVHAVGQTSFGVYQAMASFAAYLVLFEFGTGTIMTRNIALCKTDPLAPSTEEKKQATTIFTTCIILSVIILLVAAGFYFFIPSIYSNSLTAEEINYGRIIFIFAAVNLFFSFINQTLNGLLLAYEFYIFENRRKDYLSLFQASRFLIFRFLLTL